MPRVTISSIGAALVTILLLSVSLMSHGHHSRANYQFDMMLELEGTITSHNYRNPHVFLTLETESESGEMQEWLLAGNSVSNLRHGGWNAETFAVGDQVTVRGNPDRDPDKLLLFLDVVTKADGHVYRSGKIAPGGQTKVTTEGSTDFSGVWQPDFSTRNIAAGFMPADLPMTAKGQQFLNAYDMADDQALNCEPESLPMTLLPIYPVQFSRVGSDELHIRYEQFDGRRLVHLGIDEHPVDIAPSHMGHSIGQIEGNLLTIDTVHFTEDNWGLGRGTPSGLQKHVVERYTLANNGTLLRVEYTFEDPEFLREPVTETGELQLKPGYIMEAWDCDRESARRHLSLD